MFLKKYKILIKNISSLIKKPNGSIAVIVLIVGIAIVIAVSALSAYMIKDVRFTQVDEQKLKALNIAEAGISNMYLNLDKFYNGDINGIKTPLPGVTTDGVIYKYNGDLKDGTEVLGTYYVEYKIEGSTCTINSKGIDTKSQSARKVAVKINIVQQSSSSGIYDYIYTGQSAAFTNNSRVIDGPFYTEGNLLLDNSGAILQVYNSGPVVIKGNLTMSGDATSLTAEDLLIGGDVVLEGSAKIKGGPVSIAGNLTMSGGTLIGDPLASPIIIMKDLTMSGSATIGKSGDALVLSCQGTEISYPWTPIYATRDNSLTYTFSDPNFDVSNLVDTYKGNVESSALVINNNVSLIDGTPYPGGSSGTNRLSFVNENGKWIMDIQGNVIINGSLRIGGTSWYPKSADTIYYRGSGVIYTSSDITTYAKLVPLNSYPSVDLLVFVSETNIIFDIFDFWDAPDCASANIYTVAIAKGNISLLHGTVKGTLLAEGSLNIDKDFGKVCYEEEITKYLPSDLPASSTGNGNTVFTQDIWQELNP